MKIYVACLASYNNGVLHGEWFDLDDYIDAQDLLKAVTNQVLVTSKFPNVEAACPTCGGDGIHPYTTAVGGMTCAQCSGTGKVPSAEEWAIHDHEGFPSGTVGEYTSFEELFGIKAFYEEAESHFGDDAADIVEAFNYCFGNVFDNGISVENIQDAYQGKYDCERDFCQEYLTNTGEIDEDSWIYSYINWDRVWSGYLEFEFVQHDGFYFRRDW